MPAQIGLDPLKNNGAVFISDEQFRTEMKCMLKLKRETLHVHTKSIFDLYDENIDSLSNSRAHSINMVACNGRKHLMPKIRICLYIRTRTTLEIG